ncbi:MAG: AcrR family transcriptional regulator [Bacteroidia bacterium]|jgi:AcrR family transcriptional regulator
MKTNERDTEHKIKEAARLIFQQKGLSGTKTRDIAEAANINVALLNYYFRSKKKLFDIIMLETMQSFFSGVQMILNVEETSISEKISAFVDYYINLLSKNPNIPTFILNSIREEPESFIHKLGFLNQAKSSVFMRQFQEELAEGKLPPINPVHFFMNLMGMVVFPFITQPMLTSSLEISSEAFEELMNERKRLIPRWIDSMLTVQ